jgi:hypothetical protein
MIPSMKRFGLLPVLSLWLPSALAAPQFVASEIPRSNLDARMYKADMNGDGKSDLLLAHWSEEQGRELHIYLQQPDGRFPALPSRTVEVRPEIIGFGTAELRSEPGTELVFLGSDAVYSFSSAIDSYSGNLKKLVDWPSIASTPERKEIAYLGTLPDLDKDGHADLLLADEEGFGYFRGRGDESFTFVSKFTTVSGDLVSAERRNRTGPYGVNAQAGEAGEIEISVIRATSSEFQVFLSEWRPEVALGADLLREEKWIPALGFGAVNGDTLTDLMFIADNDDEVEGESNKEQRQISVLLQSAAEGFATQADWQASIDNRSLWRLVEFTGDELADLVRTTGEGTESSAYFYRNTGGTFALERPDQVLRFSGLEAILDFSDLDDDGKPELGISYISTPVLDAIRNTTIQRSRLIFANISMPQAASGEEPGLLFSRRPDYRYDESISAENILGLTSFGNLQVDLDGDGRKDYLQIAGDGTLTARTINPDLQIAAEAFWQYVPNHIAVEFTTEELNADTRPDIILQHSQHFTVLVSVE